MNRATSRSPRTPGPRLSPLARRSGARARGDWRARSDIDLAVDAPGWSAQEFLRLKERMKDLPIVYPLDVVHWQGVSTPEFVAQIERDRKLFWEPRRGAVSLPRTLGADPADGELIMANNGRYGPYVNKGKDFRSLDNEDQLLTITLDQALAILAQPKVFRRGGARDMAAAGPLREFGNDPASGRAVVAKDGRFGVYVTDGETNASLRKGDEIETLTDARASELLQDRRDRGPVKKKATKKKAAATTPKKKTAKRKTAKKASRRATKAAPPGAEAAPF